MSSNRATLFVTFKQEGFHHWPGAPESRAYLRNRHRHLFHVRVELSAPVDNKRSLEFHDLVDHCRKIMRDVGQSVWTKLGTMYDYGDFSCEQIADSMARRISRVYGTVVGVTVSEDGECGATVYADTEDEDIYTEAHARTAE